MSSTSAGTGGSSKIGFSVVYCTSYDEGYPASELEVHNPHTKGWQSARFCDYPQEIVLKLDRASVIRQIQILSHQSKIAARVELYVAPEPKKGKHARGRRSGAEGGYGRGRHDEDEEDEDDDGGSDDWQRVKFKRLGYLSLDPNERSNFKARELKSVYVQAFTRFVMLKIRKCHLNNVNLFNQVGIVALNLLGTKASDAPLDDLSVDMALDEKTARQIRDLNAHKMRAIEAEDYDEAKRLKLIINGLKQIGARVAALEKQKKEAVRLEDYDAAKRIKFEIDRLRASVPAAASGQTHQLHMQQPHQPPQHQHHQYQSPPGPHSVASGGGHMPPPVYPPSPANGSHGPYVPESPAHSAGPPASYRSPADERPIRPAASSQQGMDDHGPPLSPPGPSRSSYHDDDIHQQPRGPAVDERPLPTMNRANAMDERPLPAGNKSGKIDFDSKQDWENMNPFGSKVSMEELNESAAASSKAKKKDGEPEDIHPTKRKEAEPLIEMYGQRTTQCLYSSQWMLRVEGLDHVKEGLQQGSLKASSPQDQFSLTAKMLRPMVLDKVAKVFLSACDVLQAAVDAASDALRPEQIQRGLEPLCSSLVTRMGDSNKRVQSQAIATVLFLSRTPKAGPQLVAQFVQRPLKAKEKDKPVPLRGRGEVYLQMIPEFGFGPQSGLDLSTVMEFARGALPHRQAQVRTMAVDVITAAYLSAGPQKLMPHLVGVRKGLMDTLNASFAKAGGDTQIPYREGKPEGGASGGGGSAGGGGGSSAGGRSSSPAKRGGGSKQKKKKGGKSGNAHGGDGKKKKKRGGKGAANSKADGDGKKKKKRGNKKAAAAAASAAAEEEEAQAAAEAEQQQQHDGELHDAEGDEEGDEEELEEGYCQFCGLVDPSLTIEKLDLHYWQSCPMLASCKQCDQVIEISTINEHLLYECDVKDAYKECPRCHEAISAKNFDRHVKNKKCPPSVDPEIANRCPLCHTDVPPGQEGWKEHLLTQGCPKNPRKPVASK